MLMTLFFDLLKATAETLYMTLVSTSLAVVLGLPLGTLLFITKAIWPHPKFNKFLETIINFTRSIPFIILLVALIPFTRFIIGTAIGTNAAIVPLTIGAIPFFARLTDNIFLNLPKGLIETGFSMGVTVRQMIRYILLPEATAPLIQAITITGIALVNYSAMAGTVGGGGLGDLAIRYGYQRFNVGIMLATIVILIVIVQLLQTFGDKLAKQYQKT